MAKVGTLPNQKILDLTAELSTMKIENDLKREINENITRLRNMGTYRGRRHQLGLPVRGQNTRSGQASFGLDVGFGRRMLTLFLGQIGEETQQDTQEVVESTCTCIIIPVDTASGGVKCSIRAGVAILSSPPSFS
jgi:Ribosomal protein S13/S18